MPTFKEAAFYVENGVTYYFKDKKARDLLEKCYSPSNPPPYPVTSVNGQTGDVTIPPTSGGRIWYATCSTASGTGAKTATTTTGDFDLATGSMVRILFTTSNTAGNPTISIDGSTAKNIRPVSGSSGMANKIAAGEVIDLVYDGSNFVMTKGNAATTSFYGITKLNSSTSSTSTSEAATPSAVKDVADAKVDRAGDTMTGNLIVTKAGDTYVEVQDTDTECRLMMDSYTSGTHGLWSSGYYDGANYHADGEWLIRRKPDNEIVVNGNCTGTADNVTGTVAIAHGGTGATTAAGARANIGAVNIAGDTMSGNLAVQKTTGCWVAASSSNYGTSISLTIANPNHGVYSEGYYDGSAFHSDAKWLIYRNLSGDVIVNGKCLGTAANVTGTVAIANGGTGATDAASALAALGGCPIVQTDISGNSSATFTISSSGRGVLVLIGAAVKGMYLVNATSSGGITYSSVLAATGATLNTSTNNRLTVSVTGFVTAAMLTINGTIGLV